MKVTVKRQVTVRPFEIIAGLAVIPLVFGGEPLGAIVVLLCIASAILSDIRDAMQDMRDKMTEKP